MFFKRKIKLVTHNATFHADDVFSTACLKIYFRKIEKRGVKIIRSRDKDVVDSGDVVYDVGQIYNPETNRYDHHQEGGAGFREYSKVPYSAFGLIWKHFGEKLVSTPEIHRQIDEKFVQQICAADTAFLDLKIVDTDWVAINFDGVIKSFNPYDSENSRDSDKIFKKIVLVVEKIIEQLINKYEKEHADSVKVLEFYEKSPDKRFVVLDRHYMWKDALIDKPEVLYVIFPGFQSDQYRILAVPVAKKSFKTRKPFPEGWRGKEKQQLRGATGNNGAFFAHNSGHMVVVDSLENALDLVRKAIDD